MNDWQAIWRDRGFPEAGRSWMSRALEADGYDLFGTLTEDAYRAYALRVGAAMGVASGDSVFDVGCGAGAFLIAFADQGLDVGGIDIAERLVTEAAAAMPQGDFGVAEASELPTTPPYDVVVASGAFQYFPDLDYASKVLERMVAKAHRAVAILDVPDAALQADTEAMRREALGDEDYERRYSGLSHLYFDRAWFEGRTSARVVGTEQQHLAGYTHADYRFNVYLETG